MKKSKFIRVCAILVTTCIAACFCCSCMGNDDSSHTGVGIEEEINHAKTQLYVSNFNGGYGEKWLKDVKKRFEEENSEKVYEEGKKGVQVLIDNAKVTGKSMIDQMKNSRNQVFFNESVNYYSYATQGLVLDLTDMIQTPLTEYGETKSIYDKMTEEQKQYLSIDGKYYMVPHYEGYNGITVNVDLLDSRRLFLGKDGQFRYRLSETDKLSLGPDNKAGTYDDGLPATYDEFYGLCRELKKRGIAPLTWSGEYQFYVKNLVTAMAADDNGKDETVLGFSFNGESQNLIKLDTLRTDGTYQTEMKKIENANGYDILRQEGYYNALKFLETIIRNEWYSDTSFTGGQEQTDTQNDFLLSTYESTIQEIAMIVEGCWWENEATDTFNQMSGYPNAGKMERRFRFIPFPKSSPEKVGQGQTLLEDLSAYGFINAKIDPKYKDLAIEFLRYCNTDRSLVDFHTTVNVPKALQYTMTEENLAKCSYFGRSLYEKKNAEGTSVVYPLSDNPMFNLEANLSMTYRITYGAYEYPSKAMKDSGLSAETYFKELNASLQKGWENNYGKYFD